MADGASRDLTFPVTPAAGLPPSWAAGLPGRWRLEHLLGHGGQAEVWLAFDQQVRQLVALKVYRPGLVAASLERLRREVRIGRELQHPNLVRLFELLEVDDRLVLAMEWMPGGSLGARLDREGPLPVLEVVAVAEHVLDALVCLHSHGLMHRDVKPCNFLLDATGEVHLADLGLAKPLGDEERVTLTATTVGSPGYMSPEQIRGQTLTPASDLYSLGISLYELLTGERPFARGSHFEEAQAQVGESPRDPRLFRRDAPQWLARFIMRLIERRPTDRFADAGAALAAFRRRRGLFSPRRRRLGAVAVAAAVVIAVVGLTLGPRVVKPFLARRTATVTSRGNTVRGFDSHEEEIWLYTLENPVVQVERADLFGEGALATVVVAHPTGHARPPRPVASEVMIVDGRGAVVSRVRPEEVPGLWPAYDSRLADPSARVVDLLGDGHHEIALVCYSRTSYVTTLLVFWPQRREWVPTLRHSGFIDDLVVLPGGGRSRLLVIAMNNRLCTLRTIGLVSLTRAADRRIGPAAGVIGSPDESPTGDARGQWEWYVPLEERAGLAPTLLSPRATADGGFACDVYGGPTIRLDAFANPIPGPNAGRDLREARAAFLDGVEALRTRGPVTGAFDVTQQATALAGRFAPLLAEKPYRQIYAAAFSEALENVGDHSGAIAVLREALASVPCEDLTMRFALLEALAGNTDEARRRALSILESPSTPNGGYRAPRLLFGLAVAAHDETVLRRLLALWGRAGDVEAVGTMAALMARARLFWDRPQVGDDAVGSFTFCPEGDAVAALARWRLGLTRKDDPERMAALATVYPDMTLPCLVARAAALLALGQAAAAVGALEGNSLEARGDPLVDGYMNYDFRELAAGLHIRALASAGHLAEAMKEGRRLRPTLRPRLLPAILVDEVLNQARTGKERRGNGTR